MDNQDIDIEEMKMKLEEVGATELWGHIERIGNWQTRIAYRSIFFQAGGSLD